MNYCQKQFGKKIVALTLLAALLIPSVIQFFHLFENHNHIGFDVQQADIHISITKCDLCSFHFASLDYDILNYPDFVLGKMAVEIEVTFTSLPFHSFKVTNTQLRAPPIFS